MKSGPARPDPADTQAKAERHLEVAGVTKRFGSTVVLQDLSIAVGRSEFVSLLGPSGCGKTTLLRLIAGLLVPELGTISVGGRDLTRVAAHRRNIGVVFQNYALFPHLTAAENVAFGLKAQRVAKAEIHTRVREALSLVRMEGFADRSVLALSGGQQQRIAVARAIVVKPSLLLLDEPFSALDRKLRETMQIELRHLLRELSITSIFVTHDQDEALVMSDRIAVMNEGRIEQLASPSEVYSRPSTLYVLEFVGQSTRIAGRVVSASAGTVMVETPYGRVSASGSFTPNTSVVIGVRPEAILLGEGSRFGVQQHPGEAFRYRLFRAEDQPPLRSRGAVRPPSGRAGAPAAIAVAGRRRRTALAGGGHHGVSGAMTTVMIEPAAVASMKERRTRFDSKALLAAPGLVFMTFAFAVPVVLLVAESFTSPQGLTLDGYRKVLGDNYYVGIIWNSIKLALITTFATLIIGYPAAFALARAKGILQVVLFALIFLPLTVSIIVKTFGISIMMARGGIINWLLINIGFIERPIRLVFTEFNLYFGMVNVFLPFMILPLYSSMRMLDTRLTDAAASLGAGPVYTFTRVTLPLTMPGVIAGVSLVFAITVASYVTPSLLIGDRYMTMSQVMAKAYLNIRDFQLGASMAVIMLVIATVIVVSASFLARAQKEAR